MIDISEFVDQYQKLIIRQYYDKPNAKAEIGVRAENWGAIAAFFDEFAEAFDLDTAVDDRLDKIGKIVGVSRNVTFLTNGEQFGFDYNIGSRGFADFYDSERLGAPFLDFYAGSDKGYTLNNGDYRFFIKVKIAVNNTSAFLFSDEYISINDVVNEAFDGGAYVVDNRNMSLSLYVSPSLAGERLDAVIKLGLLPRPQGVRYSKVVLADIGSTFGFSSNVEAKGFSDPLNPSRESGHFALALEIQG
jgi:hypothetical protein